MSFVPGTRVDRYELVRAVASGGMGTVWLAQVTGKHGFEKKVAVKTIRPDLATSQEARAMFLDEARMAARIDHAHVAQVLDVGEDGDNVYLVLEWVDGASLEKLCVGWAERGESPPVGELLRIIADACEGLEAAHGVRDEHGDLVGLVHRDVSPQNILVARSGITKVIDFGIAKARDRLAGETEAGMVRGKRAYMAPEQAYGLIVDRRADVWALGATLFRALVGRPPYTSLAASAEPVAIPADLPEPVSGVLAKALAQLPSDRYQTAAEMQRAVEDAAMAIPARASSLDVATRCAPLLEPTYTPAPRELAPTVPSTENSNAAPKPMPQGTQPTQPTVRDKPTSVPDVVPVPVPVPVPAPTSPPRDRPLIRNLVLVAALATAVAVGAVWRGSGSTPDAPPPAPPPSPPIVILPGATPPPSIDAGVASAPTDAATAVVHSPTNPTATLEALVRDGSFSEAIAHLKDTPTAARDAHWLDLAATASAGLLATYSGDDALAAIEKLDRDYPKLRSSPKYTAARAQAGFTALRACIEHAGSDPAPLDTCLQRGLHFAAGTDSGAVMPTLELLQHRYQPHATLPILASLLGGKADPALCKHPRMAQAVISGLEQDPKSNAAHEARTLLELCWDGLAEPARAEFDGERSKRGAVHQNACPVFLAKGVLSELETTLCRETAEIK